MSHPAHVIAGEKVRYGAERNFGEPFPLMISCSGWPQYAGLRTADGGDVARRHTSGFEVIGMSQDPTPGDPDGIRLLATRYAAIGDQAAVAFGILGKGGAVEQGKGEAMDKLREALESLPDKLSKTAESFQAAVRAYNTYSTQLEDAQGQVDTAMDNALAVAAAAARTVPALPADATGEQRDTARQEQDDIDAAQSGLSAARRMAEDARSLREQASARAAADLDAAAANAIPERNFFQKVGDFFKDFPFVQIIINALVAIVSIFFPVIGLALGALAFVFTQVVLGQNGEIRLGDLLLGIVTSWAATPWEASARRFPAWAGCSPRQAGSSPPGSARSPR
jgi:exonuclease VII small subunit